MSIKKPIETNNYVPTLEALKRIVQEPERYGASLPDIVDAPYFREVAISQDMDVNVALKLSGLSEMEFLALNPSVKRPLIMAAATPRLLLPFDAAERFDSRLVNHRGKIANWTAIKLSESQRVESIASRFGTTASALRQVNSIPSGMKPGAGSTLLVPSSRVSASQVDDAMVATAAMSLTRDVVRIQLTA